MAHLQAVFALPFYCKYFLFISSDKRQFIQKNFAKKPCPLRYWTKANFYGNHADDVICIAQTNDEICLTYASENQFEKINEILGMLGE